MAWLLLTLATFGYGAERVTSLTLDGRSITNITSVKLGPDARVLVLYRGGGSNLEPERLPADFLQSWDITSETIAAARKQSKTRSEEGLEQAIRNGLFREVEGVVYDIRKPAKGWESFSSVPVVAVARSEGVIINLSSSRQDPHYIFVHGLPNQNTLADGDRVTFTAKLIGNVPLRSTLGGLRTVKLYDCGKICRREEIPDAILKEGRTFAEAGTREYEKPPKDYAKQLPDSRHLQGSGTGFFITEDGYLITNNHVVRNAKRVRVKQKNSVYDAEVVKTDAKSDLALVKVQGTFPCLHLAKATAAALGEPVFTIGFPNVLLQGLEPKYTDGKISSLAGMQDDPTQYQISVPVQPGNSGGPLVDTSGNVVGVIVARLNDLSMLHSSGALPQNVNYAIKLEPLRDLLKRTDVVKLPADGAILKPEDAIKAAEEAVGMVLVY